MSHTRLVTSPAHTVTGEPAARYRYVFAANPGTITAHAVISPSPVTVDADEDGAFAVNLEVGIPIVVTEYTPTLREGRDPRYQKGATYTIVVPEGATPITLATIRAGAITEPTDPTLTNAVAQVASDLSDHEGDTDNPHGVTAHQTGAYTQAEIDNALSDKAEASAVPTELTDLDTSVTGSELDALKQAADGHGDIVTHNAAEFATAAQGDKADTAVQPGDLGSAAYTDAGAYATATQGGKADSAVQPSALATALGAYETTTQLNSRDTANRDRDNHTGTQAMETVEGLGDALDGKLATADAPELIRDTMGTALVAGDNITITPDDGDDTITIAARDAPFGSTTGSSFISTKTHGGGFLRPTTRTIPADRLWISPIRIPAGMTEFIELAISVNSASDAGAFRLGLFALEMNVLEKAYITATTLADIGTVSTATTGLKTLGHWVANSPDALHIPVTPGMTVAIGGMASEPFTAHAHTVTHGCGVIPNVDAAPSAVFVSPAGAAPFGPFAPTYDVSLMSADSLLVLIR